MILSLLFYEFLAFLNNTRFIGREVELANPQNTQLTNKNNQIDTHEIIIHTTI